MKSQTRQGGAALSAMWALCADQFWKQGLANGHLQERFPHQGWSAALLLMGHRVGWWGEGKILERWLDLSRPCSWLSEGWICCNWMSVAKGRGSSDRDEKLAVPMGLVLTDLLISQSLFSVCGSHGREKREKEKGIKAYLQPALIAIFCIRGHELCVCISVFPFKPANFLNSMRSGSGTEFLKFH